MKKKLLICLFIFMLGAGAIGYHYFLEVPKCTKVITLPKDILDKYTVQGVCKAEDYILVSAYERNKFASIVVLDHKGKELSQVIIESPTHAGGIAYYDQKVYVSGLGILPVDTSSYIPCEGNPKQARIEIYNLNDIVNPDNHLKTIHKCDEINLSDHDELLYSDASTRTDKNCLISELDIGEYNGEMCIFVSNYREKKKGHLVIVPIQSSQDHILVRDLESYQIPVSRTQGVCFKGNNTFLYTQSNGWTVSKLVKCKIKNNKLVKVGVCNLPPHAEQVSLFNDHQIIVAFENNKKAIRIYNIDDLQFN